jgi:hypothetical protein
VSRILITGPKREDFPSQGARANRISTVDHLSKLENQSIYILREAYNKFDRLAMLWSIGNRADASKFFPCLLGSLRLPFKNGAEFFQSKLK